MPIPRSRTAIVTISLSRRTATHTVLESGEYLTALSMRFQMARPNASGSYAISGLPAGDYFVVADHELMEGEWEDAQYLKAAAARAIRATLKRGESQSLDLKLTKR